MSPQGHSRWRDQLGSRGSGEMRCVGRLPVAARNCPGQARIMPRKTASERNVLHGPDIALRLRYPRRHCDHRTESPDVTSDQHAARRDGHGPREWFGVCGRGDSDRRPQHRRRRGYQHTSQRTADGLRPEQPHLPDGSRRRAGLPAVRTEPRPERAGTGQYFLFSDGSALANSFKGRHRR